MENAALVAVIGITMAIIQGGIGLVKFLINKYSHKETDDKANATFKKLVKIEDLTVKLHEMHNRYDSDGTPIWYVPRSWADTQKDIVDHLHSITEMNMKMLGIIERLERRLDNH